MCAQLGPRTAANRPPRNIEEHEVEWDRLQTMSGHVLQNEGVTHFTKFNMHCRCLTCQAVVSRQSASAWMRETQCTGQQLCGMHMDFRARAYVGRSILQQSHVLHWRSGLRWCGICGAYSVAKVGKKPSPRMLARKCIKKRS